jgi:segregation and condensation protein A
MWLVCEEEDKMPNGIAENVESPSLKPLVSSPLFYRVKLDIFEGPLDLLLHLVKKNEVDPSDIPIATITDQYMAYLELFQQLDLDIAGEYLVMAATLLHLKSRTLLPGEDTLEDEEGEDPRAELVRQLLEYQRFKEAAEMLNRRDLLDRDIFARDPAHDDNEAEQDLVYDVALGDLLDALQDVLKRAAPEVVHEVVLEQISLRERVCFILDTLRERKDARFTDLFPLGSTRLQILTTFLALLELVRMRMIQVAQEAQFGPITLSLAVSADTPMPESLEQI